MQKAGLKKEIKGYKKEIKEALQTMQDRIEDIQLSTPRHPRELPSSRHLCRTKRGARAGQSMQEDERERLQQKDVASLRAAWENTPQDQRSIGDGQGKGRKGLSSKARC